MARARKSHVRSEEETKSTRGLKPPYRTGKPGDNPYVVYADLKSDRSDRLLVLSFGEYYSAQHFLNLLIEQDTWVECDPVGSRVGFFISSGIRVTMFGDDIWRILEYKPTPLEDEWEDEQLKRSVYRFKYGRDPERLAREDSDDGEKPRAKSSTVSRTIKDDARRADRPKREPKSKVDRSGLVSANDIANEIGVKGIEVRTVLRSLKLVKPEGGWLFDKKTAEQIREKVKAGLKAAKKK